MTLTEAADTQTTTEPAVLLERLAGLKREQLAIKVAYAETEEALIDALGSGGSIVAVAGTKEVTGTVVAPERLIVDEVALQASLTRYRWLKVTKRVLDLSAFKAALEAGVISTKIARKVAHTEATKPYVKLTFK